MTNAIKAYVNQKIGALSSFVKRFEKRGDITLFLEIARSTKHHKHGEVFYAEATLALPGKTIRVEEYNTDLYRAIDGLKKTLKRDIIKYKSKLVHKTNRKKAGKS